MIALFVNITNLLSKYIPGKGYALFTAAIFLGGCALSQNNERQTDVTHSNTELSAEQLTAELNAIRESHKKLQRLSELEGDLMMILNELASQSKIKQHPSGFRSKTTTEKVEPDPPPEPAGKVTVKPQIKIQDLSEKQSGLSTHDVERQSINKNASQNPQSAYALAIPDFKSSDYVLWLGFFISENAAIAGMNRLHSKFNYRNQGLKIKIVSNANQRGQYYGLMMGPFQSQQQATVFCSSLVNYGQYCKVRQIP